ncbi:MAG: NUDIX hydrolase [Anaerolineae bacterium]|nr:NUDIX hydrolase [Anaerolineae bacterium]
MAQYKTQFASLFRRMPWLGVVGTWVYRLRQARYTVGAVGVVFDDDGRILLLEHVFHPYYPWGLPGGWVDRREDPAAAVERELREETGLDVRVISPLSITIGMFPDHLDLTYLCHCAGGQVRLSGEILAYAWVDPDDLPDLFTTQQRAIAQAMRLREMLL